MNLELDSFYHGDAIDILKTIDENSVHAVVTDPPYFLDKLDSKWNFDEVASKKNQQVVTSLPSGMKFGKEQGENFYNWYLEVSKLILKVLKPGGYFFSFSSPRLYHNMAYAIDNAGFMVRDQFLWLYTQNQPKAMSLDHFIKKLNVTDDEKERLKSHLSGWKTPQVKSCHEPICMAQKPTSGTFLKNEMDYDVGLINTNIKLGLNDDMFVANVLSEEGIDEVLNRYFLVAKPNKKEKGEFNEHKTVKPVSVCKFLICLCTKENQTVLDPFCGSGTTCVAAKLTNRKFIGIDNVEKYLTIAKQRIIDHENNK